MINPLPFLITIQIPDEDRHAYPTIYTIDYLNNFVAFDEMGKHYQLSLDNVLHLGGTEK